MARKKPSLQDKQITDFAVGLAEHAATVIAAAEKLHVRNRTVENFPLKGEDRSIFEKMTLIDPRLRNKIWKKETDFTVAETAILMMGIAESFIDASPKEQIPLMMAAEKLMKCLQANLVPRHSIAKAVVKNTATLFQFKITLIDIHPAIWRRIQVPDCTLGDLHYYIQAAFGWENCHMHQFVIEKKFYGTPTPYDDDLHTEDEEKFSLSNMLPLKTRKKIRWLYEYDFGDGWRHEVLFEGNPPVDPKVKAPVCLEGERACPPEDCGGPWGYDDFVAAITNRKHPRHQELREWIGEFDPEMFDAKSATKEMRRVK